MGNSDLLLQIGTQRTIRTTLAAVMTIPIIVFSSVLVPRKASRVPPTIPEATDRVAWLTLLGL